MCHVHGLGRLPSTNTKEPDLLLLDEPTNHLDLDTIEWLEGYLNKQDVPMVIISHDRAFLDQLCTKIVETDMGVSRTYVGNYSKYVLAKVAWVEAQNAAWEKQQKKIEHTKDIISRLGAGANVGRASSAEKVLGFRSDFLVQVEENVSITAMDCKISRTGFDVYQQARKLFLSKVLQYIKERLLLIRQFRALQLALILLS